MSKHFPGFGSDKTTVESEAAGSESPNGSVEEPAAGGEAGLQSSAVAGETTSTPDGWADAEVGAAAAAVDDASVFLAELVRTLQTTAGLERVRIAEETEQRRQAHIDQIRSRQASEADRMRELSDDDTKAIDAWADGETKRIQQERERRATKRHDDLDNSLAVHTSKIDEEIDRVETAIATYRAQVDEFFDGLDRQTDLVLIAKHATNRPAFPELDAVAAGIVPAPAEVPQADADYAAATAGAAGESESAVVGVMDPEPAAAQRADWWAPSPDPEPALAAAFEDADKRPEARRAGSLFQSTPVERPMSGRRDDKDGSNRDG